MMQGGSLAGHGGTHFPASPFLLAFCWISIKWAGNTASWGEKGLHWTNQALFLSSIEARLPSKVSQWVMFVSPIMKWTLSIDMITILDGFEGRWNLDYCLKINPRILFSLAAYLCVIDYFTYVVCFECVLSHHTQAIGTTMSKDAVRYGVWNPVSDCWHCSDLCYLPHSRSLPLELVLVNILHKIGTVSRVCCNRTLNFWQSRRTNYPPIPSQGQRC